MYINVCYGIIKLSKKYERGKIMDKKQVEITIRDLLHSSGMNIIDATVALDDEAVGLTIFDSPLVGFASADNDYLKELRTKPEAKIKLDPPKFWLPEAKTVVSFFLPFTETITQSNIGGVDPSIPWLHGRIEGQALISDLLTKLKKYFEKEGFEAVVPILDKRFWAKQGGDTKEEEFGSNWSERHVAYAAGLGTFSLSKNLITKKGVAGRFGSLVTTAEIEPTIPQYDELEQYCIKCCMCGYNCPTEAISLEHGKMHKPCSDYLDLILEKNDPYYGCGKCQVGVPCQSENPAS